MGNYWKAISEDDLVRAEVDLLKRGGLMPEDFKLMNIRVSNLELEDDESVPQIHEEYLHCVEILNRS